MSVTASFFISSGPDDGYGYGPGTFNNVTSSLSFTSYLSKKLFMRFTDVTIPRGSIISDAHIYHDVDGYSGDFTYIGTKAYLNDVNDAVAPKSWPELSGKVLTTAYAVDSVDYGYGWKNFEGLASAVQEVVDRPGWSSGNAMMVIFVPYEGGPSTWVSMNSYDGGFPAQLHVTYIPPPPIGGAQIIGLELL